MMRREGSRNMFYDLRAPTLFLALLALSSPCALAHHHGGEGPGGAHTEPETPVTPPPSPTAAPTPTPATVAAPMPAPMEDATATATSPPVNTSTASAEPAGTCAGDGDYSCPATDPVKTEFRSSYDPTTVDWNALVADIIAIGTKEPRFCNFAIRSWFHDISGFGDGSDAFFPHDGAADGSFVVDFDEMDHPEGALHGFGQFTRHVILQIAAAHGASHADVLTVAAAKCTTEVLGGAVDIASHCEAAGFPLSVGKMDFSVDPDYKEWKWLQKVRIAPLTHHRLTQLLEFFLTDINGLIDDAAWRVSPDEVAATMGAHAIMMTHACTTNGESPTGDSATIGDRTCGGAGGRQRMFTWDNSFFQDVTAGYCQQNNELIDGGDFSMRMPLEDHQAFTQCGFRSTEGFELTEQLECSSMKRAIAKTKARNDYQDLHHLNRVSVFNKGWQSVVWGSKYSSPRLPIEKAAPCCGHQCGSCADDPDSKFWCEGPMKKTEAARMWPYTYMDCEFNKLFNYGAEGYCEGKRVTAEGKEITCIGCKDECDKEWRDNFGNDPDDLISHFSIMTDAMELFRENNAAWEESYATAFCKLSNFGATYSPSKAAFTEVFTGATTGCLDVASVLSPKKCESCELDKFGTLSDPGPLTPSTPPSVDPVALPPVPPVDTSVRLESGDDVALSPEPAPIDDFGNEQETVPMVEEADVAPATLTPTPTPTPTTTTDAAPLTTSEGPPATPPAAPTDDSNDGPWARFLAQFSGSS